MVSGLASAVALETLADLLAHLGGIPAHRVRLHPPPGTATEADVLNVHDHEDRLCELVDGVLVEKAMGFRESLLAAVLIRILGTFVERCNLGLVTGADGMMRLAPGLVRIPDVAFIAWHRFPNRRVPTDPIPTVSPDVAIEVLSASNTTQEMRRKCHEYFAAGVQLIWLVDPQTRTIAVYTIPEQCTTLRAEHMLEGGAVLPGFILPVQELFAALDRHGDA